MSFRIRYDIDIFYFIFKWDEDRILNRERRQTRFFANPDLISD
jgi:hypothetical protein